jgi:hypothetical protein
MIFRTHLQPDELAGTIHHTDSVPFVDPRDENLEKPKTVPIIQQKTPNLFRGRALWGKSQSLLFGNPAIRNKGDPWLCVTELPRLCYYRSSDFQKNLLVPKGANSTPRV